MALQNCKKDTEKQKLEKQFASLSSKIMVYLVIMIILNHPEKLKIGSKACEPEG